MKGRNCNTADLWAWYLPAMQQFQLPASIHHGIFTGSVIRVASINTEGSQLAVKEYTVATNRVRLESREYHLVIDDNTPFPASFCIAPGVLCRSLAAGKPRGIAILCLQEGSMQGPPRPEDQIAMSMASSQCS